MWAVLLHVISSKRARLSEAAKAKAAETTKRWKLEHRERVLEMRKAHYRANCKNAEKKAKAAAQQRRWRERRHAHILEVKNAYYVANRERLPTKKREKTLPTDNAVNDTKAMLLKLKLAMPSGDAITLQK